MILEDCRPAFSVSAGENVNVSSLCQLGALPVCNGCFGEFLSSNYLRQILKLGTNKSRYEKMKSILLRQFSNWHIKMPIF